jgi:hypothetical protein
LTGLFLQWYLAENPAMRLLRRGKREVTLEDGRQVIVGHISGEVTWVEHLLFWSHLASLLAGLGFLLAYKLLIPMPPQ